MEDTITKYGDEIAAIIFECPIEGHSALYPRPGFMEKMRELCTKHNIVMIWDEVVTGFRMGLGGAQEFFGITPDLATFGKALAGGMPFSAVLGKAEIMEQLRDRGVLGPGTFNGYPLGMKAVLATIRILEKDNGAAYKHMDAMQKMLMDGLQALAAKYGFPMRIQGNRGLFFTFFGLDKDKILYDEEEDMAQLDVDKCLGSGPASNRKVSARRFQANGSCQSLIRKRISRRLSRLQIK